MNCRHCGAELELNLVDLGSAPPSNAYLTEQDLHAPERWFPLRVRVCKRCWLAQTEDFSRADELFTSDYAYFSSYTASWLAHSERFVSDMTARFGLNSDSHVIEVAANDGYLLQYVRALGIPCTGIEPTASTAAAARTKGIPIIEDFFGKRLASSLADQGLHADLMVANNVLAHVPDINDFVSGFSQLLKPHGLASFEFPHLQRLLTENQFDTIYHEHYSYLSLTAVEHICNANGLRVFDVEELATHGGSLRIFAQRIDSGIRPRESSVETVLASELRTGLRDTACYADFQGRTERLKNDFLAFLIDARRAGNRVAAYGAAAKGNTLLNYAGVRPDLIPFVVDRNPAKQGKYLPGSRIPIVDETRLHDVRPDYVVILPWNIKTELMQQLDYIRQWGGRFVTAVPALEIFI